MLSELAPVLLALRHAISPGDQLVVDEPEAHLHPGMQRSIAQFFASLVRAGVFIVVTTHSDFFLGQLNNQIREGFLATPDGLQSSLFDDQIPPSLVQGIRFERSASGCAGIGLTVDPTDGIDESSFADVMESLYTESVNLSQAIEHARRS